MPVRALGFVTRFKTAPPDFTAQTVVNLTNHPATLLINWRPPTAAPFVSNTDAGLLLNLAGVGAVHHIWRGPVATDLMTLGASPTIVPENPDRGFFARGSNGRVEVFTQFSAYRVALEPHLAQAQMANTVGAHGMYRDTSVTITADQIYTALQ
jgi:hypothetical protein